MKPNAKQLNFQKLVDELMKIRPSAAKVRALTQQLGLPYSADPIAQLDFVLKSAEGFFFHNDKMSGAGTALRLKSDLEG